MSLKFTCPLCGEHILECIMNNGHSSTVTEIHENGQFEYNNKAVDADLSHYQCDNCGCVLVDEDNFDIQDDEEIVEWIKKHC